MKVKNLFHAGVDDALDADLRTRVIASNAVFITILIIMLIILGLQVDAYLTHGFQSFRAAVPITIFFITAAGIVLNHYRFFLISRLIFFLSWTLLVTAFPVWRTVTVYGYFLHPIFGIVSSTMVLLIFSYRKEKFIYISFLTFSMAITVFSFEFVSWFDDNGVAEIVLTYTTRFRLHFYPLFFTLFFNLVLIYVFRMNENFFRMKQQQHQIIVNQNKQLDENRLKLEQTNSELESRVRERTLELTEKNNRLMEYAFLHAHVLQAPVSRIRGLLNLLALPISKEEEITAREMLSQTMKELDDSIQLMNEKLQATQAEG